MDDNDEKRFVVLLGKATTVYNKKLSNGEFEIYWNLLKEYPFDLIATGFKLHMQCPDFGTFFPKPCDIVRKMQLGYDEIAIQAWTLVFFKIKKHGYTHDYNFHSNSIHLSIELLGGIQGVYEKIKKNCPFVEKDFIRHFISFVKNGSDNKLPILHGSDYYSLYNKKVCLIDIPDGEKYEKLRNNSTLSAFSKQLLENN